MDLTQRSLAYLDHMNKAGYSIYSISKGLHDFLISKIFNHGGVLIKLEVPFEGR